MTGVTRNWNWSNKMSAFFRLTFFRWILLWFENEDSVKSATKFYLHERRRPTVLKNLIPVIYLREQANCLDAWTLQLAFLSICAIWEPPVACLRTFSRRKRGILVAGNLKLRLRPSIEKLLQLNRGLIVLDWSISYSERVMKGFIAVS